MEVVSNMKVVEQRFSFADKIQNNTTHLSADVPSELTEKNKKHNGLMNAIRRINIIMMVTIFILAVITSIIVIMIIPSLEVDVSTSNLINLLIGVSIGGAFMFLNGLSLSYVSKRSVSNYNMDMLNIEIMNKDGQVVRLYKLIDAKRSRVDKLFFDVQEYRYFTKDIHNVEERNIAETSCKVPKISHSSAYNLMMTIQDMAILTEHEKVAEDEKQNEIEKRKQQAKIERMKMKYQKANQFSKEDLDNMTDIQTLKAMEDKIQHIRKNEEKMIESWLNDGK